MPPLHSNAIELPGPLQRQLEAAARGFFEPEGMRPFDFSEPAGEPALIPPDSVSWRIFKNPVALFIGGVGAVLLELAEPRVRDGVWQHSSFRTDALPRLQRTGLAAMVTVYGPRSKAGAMIAGVVRAHGRVTGETSEGLAYRANDEELLNWVQATASFGFIEAYSAFARRLSQAEKDRAYAEAAPAAHLYGASGAPRSTAELDRLFEAMAPKLVRSPVIDEFLSIMTRVRALPAPARPFQRLLLKAAVDILPSGLAARLGLAERWRLRGWERALVGIAARAADRTIIRSSPAVISCRRLGLPDDWLFEQRDGSRSD